MGQAGRQRKEVEEEELEESEGSEGQREREARLFCIVSSYSNPSRTKLKFKIYLGKAF